MLLQVFGTSDMAFVSWGGPPEFTATAALILALPIAASTASRSHS